MRSDMKRLPELVVQTLTPLASSGKVSLLAVVSFLPGVPLLAGARWVALLGFVPEFPLVPAGVVKCRGVVGCAAAAVSRLQAVAGSVMR